MADCSNCSAPLVANTNQCPYCGVRNDVDLHGKHDFSVSNQNSERACPHCETVMQTIEVGAGSELYIERCESCFGLFFDPGEIEELLERSVSNVFDVNVDLIKNINEERYKSNQDFRYVKCPDCQVMMNRVNFGQRSGVIVDQCKKHGVWLDSGEITHLMEWKKAGGEKLNARIEQQKERKKESSTRSRLAASSESYDLSSHRGRQGSSMLGEDDLLESVSSLVFKLFS